MEMVARKNVENEKVVGKGVKRFVVIILPQRCNYTCPSLLKQLSFMFMFIYNLIFIIL